MNILEIFDSRKTLNLLGLKDNLDFLINLDNLKMFPKVLMISGKKGIGKSTLISHFLNYKFDAINYDKENNIIKKKGFFYNQFLSDIFPNVIYLNGYQLHKIKIEDIRKLKKRILQTPLNNLDRYVILDDVDLFNKNSLNALLKIIEEPNTKTFFILINNETKPLIETIKSRCIEIKIILKEKDRKKITSALLKNFNQNIFFDLNLLDISPGNFLKYNYIFENNKLNANEDFFYNFKFLLDLYKKEKNTLYIELSIFYVDYYFKWLKEKKIYTNEKLVHDRLLILKNLNNFHLYNLNLNSMINNIEICFQYE